jgi:hypothetical protein
MECGFVPCGRYEKGRKTRIIFHSLKGGRVAGAFLSLSGWWWFLQRIYGHTRQWRAAAGFKQCVSRFQIKRNWKRKNSLIKLRIFRIYFKNM